MLITVTLPDTDIEELVRQEVKKLTNQDSYDRKSVLRELVTDAVQKQVRSLDFTEPVRVEIARQIPGVIAEECRTALQKAVRACLKAMPGEVDKAARLGLDETP